MPSNFQSAGLAALGIVSGGVTIGNAGTVAAPIAKKRPSNSTLGTIAINDIIATKSNSLSSQATTENSVTLSIAHQETQRTPNSVGTGRIGYGTLT